MHSPIVVVGSSNTDMVLKTDRFPVPGETILGGDFFMFQGGKGANQAVAAARLKGDITFICKIGSDLFGRNAVEHYSNEGINVSRILSSEQVPTGVAMITVNKEGENEIVVASGANALLTAGELQQCDEALLDAAFILTQLETPLSAIEYLAAFAHNNGKKLILNPAPAANIPASIYEGLFLITPNQTEAALLTGITVADEDTAERAAIILKDKGVSNIIITMGARGAYVNCGGEVGMIESVPVKAVDSTAAGDVFNGALVVALTEGMKWKEAVSFSCRAAALSVTVMGAQSSAPYRKDLDAFLTTQSAVCL